MNIQMIIILSIVILVLLVLLKIKFKKKINQGEKEVNKILKTLKGYKLLSDIMIKRNIGTSQIDHILIGKKGIFVIETKDYSGIIYGEQYSKYWTQIINKNRTEFYNPIRQNYGHIKALEECLKIRNIFIPIVVFTNKSKFKKIKVDTPVIQLKRLKGFIKRYKSDINLSKDEIEYIYNFLKKANIKSTRVRKKHVKQIIKNVL